jgi:hypothetical protein
MSKTTDVYDLTVYLLGLNVVTQLEKFSNVVVLSGKILLFVQKKNFFEAIIE